MHSGTLENSRQMTPISNINTELARPAQPALIVSNTSLEFAKTFRGKPQFQLLTIAQQDADTPVTVSTNAPDQFQLACDERPAFTTSLTFTPLIMGTYVHVRYAPVRLGVHKAELLIETPYETQVVTLVGRSTGIAPTLSNIQAIAGRSNAVNRNRDRKGNWLGLLAVLIAGGLGVFGYLYRCQLAPSLCQAMTQQGTAASKTTTIKTFPVAIPTTIASSKVRTKSSKKARKPLEENRLSDRRPVSEQQTEKVSTDKQLNDKIEEAASQKVDKTLLQSSPRPKPNEQNLRKSSATRPQVQPVPSFQSEESELERELNHKSANP